MKNPYPIRKRPVYEFFTFAGKSSLDFLINLGNASVLDRRAERDYTSIAIPGRNGELTIDGGKYKNVVGDIELKIGNGLEVNLSAFADFLAGYRSYERWEDTFHPDEFRMVRILGGFDPSFVRQNGGTFKLRIDAMPQRWEKRGEIPLVIDGSLTVINQTNEEAEPLFVMTGNGNTITVLINTWDSVRIPDANGEIVIDSQMKTITQNGSDILSRCTFSPSLVTKNYFPKLEPGENAITIQGSTAARIVPRWWHR